MPEIGLSGSMSGEWKRDLRAPAPFLDSTAPEDQSAPFDTFRHPDPNEINNVRNEMPQHPPESPCQTATRPQPQEWPQNVPCPCGSNLKYSVAAESEVRHFSTPRFQ